MPARAAGKRDLARLIEAADDTVDVGGDPTKRRIVRQQGDDPGANHDALGSIAVLTLGRKTCGCRGVLHQTEFRGGEKPVGLDRRRRIDDLDPREPEPAADQCGERNGRSKRRNDNLDRRG